MSDIGHETVIGCKLQILVEEAAFIRERHSSSTKSLYRELLEVRYAELGKEIQALKKAALESESLEYRSSRDSGPFGICFGTTVDELDIDPDADLESGMYQLKSVPRPHSSFERVLVQASKTFGVCWIKGIGKNISTGADGSTLQVEFEKMAVRLERVYGSPTKVYDFLNSGSCWNEPIDWMMALLKKERHLASFWSVEDGASLQNGIATILLAAQALNAGTGCLVVEYAGANSNACEKELAAEEDKAL